MVDTAIKNGISRNVYHSRLYQGWDKEKAANTPLVKYKGDYAVYKNDEIVVIGTAEECALELGVTVEYIRWMTTPTGKRRLANRKNPDKATTAVKLDDDF